MHKIAVMGDKHSILAFKALGVSTYPVEDADEAGKLLQQLEGEQYAVVFIIEQLALKMIPEISKYNAKKYPAVIPIPGVNGSLEIGMKGIRKAVEKAVGADILFRE